MATLLMETTEIDKARAFEETPKPGTYEARFSLARPLTQAELDELHQALLDSGVEVKDVLTQQVKGLDQISVKYMIRHHTEGISQAALLIPVIPTIIVAVLIGIALFKVQDIIVLVLVVGGILVTAVFLLRKAAENYTARH